MKKRILTIFLAIVMIATIATGTLINADTTTYKYTGIAESGYSYGNYGIYFLGMGLTLLVAAGIGVFTKRKFKE